MTACSHGTRCGQARVRGCSLTGKRCSVALVLAILAATSLDSVFQGSNVRAHGFVLMDGELVQDLGRCKNALSDRMDRASLSPASSAARLCDFSSHVIQLVEALHHGWQLCVCGIPVTGQLTSRLLQSGALLLLVVLWIVARAPLPGGNLRV